MKLYDNGAYRDDFMELVYCLLHGDGDNYRANQIIDAFDSAPEVEAEPLPPNDPLTLDELRKMGGEPVWCLEMRCWGIIKLETIGKWAGMPFLSGALHDRGVAVDFEYDVVKRGLTLYRRKLEEGTT